MRTLYIHASEFSYKPVEKVKISKVEEAVPIKKEYNNVLVAFVTVEKNDFQRRNDILPRLIEDLKQHLNRLQIDFIIVYPYAHLSDKLEDPIKAVRMLKLLDREVKNKLKDVKYVRAPFGWYKEFMIHCIGHPLSELSRTF